MVFSLSLRDQNQGVRNDDSTGGAERRRFRLSVLFHPDYEGRLRNYTESADPLEWEPEGRSRAQAPGTRAFGTFTAGGDFHPAPRTCPATRARRLGY